MRFYKAVKILSLLGVLSGLCTDINGMEESKESCRKAPFSDFWIDINNKTSYKMFGQDFENCEEANKLKKSVLVEISPNEHSSGSCEDVVLLDDISCIIRLALGKVIELSGSECLTILEYLNDRNSLSRYCLLGELFGSGLRYIENKYRKMESESFLTSIEIAESFIKDIEKWKRKKGKRIFYMAAFYLEASTDSQEDDTGGYSEKARKIVKLLSD